MNFRGYAELEVSFPDDTVEENGQIVIFPGRTVAEAIAAILREDGYDVRNPEHMDEHGWDLNVYVEGRRIWLEIQGSVQEYVLQIEAMVGFFGSLRGVDLTYFAEFLTKLNEGLRRDLKFTKVSWYELRNHRPIGDPMDEPLKVMDWRG